MTSSNTMTPEDIINTLDTRYQFSLYLKLRGHVAYKAAKLAGQYLAKQAKTVFDNRSEHGLQHSDTFAQAVAFVRGEKGEVEIMSEAGMDVAPMQQMYETLRGLVEYGNKLNFDMQELIDPMGTKRYERGFVQRGVFFDTQQQRESWMNSVQLLAEGTQNQLNESYADYLSSIEDPKWALTEAEWAATQEQEENLWGAYKYDIVELLMDIGDEERDFDELDIRTQIGCIENMRGKIPACIDSVLKAVKYNRELSGSDKVAEATKLKGIIAGFNQLYCDMLDSSRYANHHEYMYSYMPMQTQAVAVGRKIRAKREEAIDRAPVGRVDDKTAESINESIESLVNSDL